MGAIPIAMAVGAPMLQAYGQYMQASDAADVMRLEAGGLDANARVNDIQTNMRENLQRRRAGEVLGEQRAGIAQSGFGSGGTMSDIARQSGTDAEMDALAIRYEGRVKSDEMRGQAEQLRYGAKQTKRAAAIGAGMSLLTGAASGYGAYASMGGTPDKLGYSMSGPSNVMRHSAIPRGFSSARSASNTLRGY